MSFGPLESGLLWRAAVNAEPSQQWANVGLLTVSWIAQVIDGEVVENASLSQPQVSELGHFFPLFSFVL